MTFDPSALRAQVPALERTVEGKKLVYLDNACTALKSKAVSDRMTDFYEHWGACGGRRSSHLLSQEVEGQVDEARAEAARFLNADSSNEIVFTGSTTDSVNLVARAFPFGDRREVILSELEHNSVYLPFAEAQRRGECRLRLCPAERGRIDLNALEGMLSDKTALIATTRASNVAGGIAPAAELCRMAHRKGAAVLLDEAQFLSSHREDVQACDADFVAFSGHKLGGPFGIGVLYGKEHRLNALGQYRVGGGSVKTVEWDDSAPEPRYLDAPGRFEGGVPNYAGILGLGEALKGLRALPEAAVRKHLSGLVRRTFDGLSKMEELGVVGMIEDLEQGSLVSFYAKDDRFSPMDFNLYLNHELDGKFVAVRVGEHCAHLLHKRLGVGPTVRASFFAYNTAAEVDVLLDAVTSFLAEVSA